MPKSAVKMARQKCTVCNKSDATECQTCKSAAYCSSNCQSEDQRTHDLVCKPFKDFIASSPRPSPFYKLAIGLPVNRAKPAIFWMKFAATTENGVSSQKPDLSLCGNDLRTPEILNITRMLKLANPGLERFSLDHTLTLYKPKSWFFDPTQKNICLAELMKGGDVYEYQGPFFVISQRGTEAKPRTIQDFALSDLRVVVDFLNTFDTVERCDRFKVKGGFISGDPSQKIKCVVISSKGDQKLCKKEHYMEVEIKGNHEAFNDDPTLISKNMGLPIITFKLPPAPEWRHHSHSALNYNPYENYEAVRMNRELDAESSRWGLSHMGKWDLRPGSILVVRADRKNITAHQVEALAAYCMEDISEAAQEYVENEMALGVDEEMDIEEEMEGEEQKIGPQMKAQRENFVRDHLCQAKFDPFFEKLRAKKVAAGDSTWLDVVSPYST